MKTKIHVKSLIVLMALFAFALSVSAQFEGDFDPVNWTFSSTTPSGDGSIDASGAPGSIILSGSNTDLNVGFDYYEEYTITIPEGADCGAVISFDYDFLNEDSDIIDYFAVTVNGVETFVTDSSKTGSFAGIQIVSGDVFGFRVVNDDDCCGRATLTVSNFKFEEAPIIPDIIELPDLIGECDLTVTDIPTASDSNCVDLVATTEDTLYYDMQGTYTINWMYENGVDTLYQEQTVIIDDITPPAITCPDDMIVWAWSGECYAIVDYVAPIGTDNCSGAVTTLTAGLPPGSAFDVATHNVTYRVTDIGGNTASCSFSIQIWDQEDPTITCPEDIVVSNDPGQCNAVVTYAPPVADDNCPGYSVDLTNGLASESEFPIGITTVEYTVTDGVGRTASCSFTVTVEDTEIPVIDCPEDLVVDNDPGECSAVVIYAPPIGTDNCPGAVTTLVDGIGNGGTFPVGINTETYVVTDGAGNTDTCSFTITVEDTEDPVITCPADIEITLIPGTCDTTLTLPIIAVDDNCPGVEVELIAGLPNGSVFPGGVTTQIIVATDAAGNTDTCSYDVIVSDTESPTITCPEGTTICQYEAIDLSPVVDDNCSVDTTYTLSGATTGSGSGVILSQGLLPGTTTVEYTATDPSGNTAVCSFDIVVKESYEQTTVAEICQGESYEMPDGSLAYESVIDTFSYPLGNGCDSTIIIDLTVNSVNVSVTQAGTTLRSNANGAEYQWFDCGTEDDIAGATAQSFTPEVTGSYGVSVTENGCTDDSECFAVTVENGLNNNLTDNILAYPNPVVDVISVDLGNLYELIEIEILNLNGQMVFESEEKNSQMLHYNLNELAPGTYFMKISTEEGDAMLRFNKE